MRKLCFFWFFWVFSKVLLGISASPLVFLFFSGFLNGFHMFPLVTGLSRILKSLGSLGSPGTTWAAWILRFLWTPRVCAFPRFLGHSHAPYLETLMHVSDGIQTTNPIWTTMHIWCGTLYRHQNTNLDNKTSLNLLVSLVKLLIDI